MLEINERLAIDEDELVFAYAHSSGPGGQNVNKVATAVQLRFDVAGSPSLPDAVRARLTALAGSRMTTSGELVIDARRHRTREANRRDAVDRLLDLVRRAATPPRPRRATRPTSASRERRLTEKRRRSDRKRSRKAPGGEND